MQAYAEWLWIDSKFFRLDGVRTDPGIGSESSGDVANEILDELRILVGTLGHVLLVFALQDTPEFAGGLLFGDLDEILEPHPAVDLHVHRDVRALVVGAVLEMAFEHGQRLVAPTSTLIHVSMRPATFSPTNVTS